MEGRSKNWYLRLKLISGTKGMKILITILFLFTFCPSGLLYAQENPWQLRKNQEDITVYTRKVDSSPILEYKADVIVNAPLPKVIALFEDEKLISRWYYQCVHSELVENAGPNEKILYIILRLPWPVTARDIVFSITRSENHSRGTISYTLAALPNRLPLAKGMIRVPYTKSVWRFTSLPKGQTEILFQQHSDPGGSIPAFLVNQLAVDTPYYSLKCFREMLTGKKD
jgi:hypothetical protein